MNAPPLPPELAAVADVPQPWMLIAAIVAISAAVAWAFTEAVKKTAEKKYQVDHDVSSKVARKKLWWTPMLVIVSVVIGFLVGAGLGGWQWEWVYGGGVGAFGGALASFIVALLKGHITALLKKKTA